MIFVLLEGIYFLKIEFYFVNINMYVIELVLFILFIFIVCFVSFCICICIFLSYLDKLIYEIFVCYVVFYLVFEKMIILFGKL